MSLQMRRPSRRLDCRGFPPAQRTAPRFASYSTKSSPKAPLRQPSHLSHGIPCNSRITASRPVICESATLANSCDNPVLVACVVAFALSPPVAPSSNFMLSGLASYSPADLNRHGRHANIYQTPIQANYSSARCMFAGKYQRAAVVGQHPAVARLAGHREDPAWLEDCNRVAWGRRLFSGPNPCCGRFNLPRARDSRGSKTNLGVRQRELAH